MDIINRFIEGIYHADIAAVRESIRELVQSKNEDALIIAIRESLATHHLLPGSKMANIIGSTLYLVKPRRNILRFIGQKLSNPSLSGSSWLDSYLASNMGLSDEEFIAKWSGSKYVAEIRTMFSTDGCATPIEAHYAIPVTT